MQIDLNENTVASEIPKKPQIARKVLWGIVGLCLLTAGFIAGTSYATTLLSPAHESQKAEDLTSSKISQPIPENIENTPTPPPSTETNSWIRYEDEKYGFSIMYPPSISEFMATLEVGSVPELSKIREPRGQNLANYDRVLFWRGPDSIFFIEIYESPASVPLIDFWKSTLVDEGAHCVTINKYNDTTRRGFCYKDYYFDEQTYTATYDFNSYHVVQTNRNHEIFVLDHSTEGIGSGEMYLAQLDEKHVVLITTNLGIDSEAMVKSFTFPN